MKNGHRVLPLGPTQLFCLCFKDVWSQMSGSEWLNPHLFLFSWHGLPKVDFIIFFPFEGHLSACSSSPVG